MKITVVCVQAVFIAALFWQTAHAQTLKTRAEILARHEQLHGENGANLTDPVLLERVAKVLDVCETSIQLSEMPQSYPDWYRARVRWLNAMLSRLAVIEGKQVSPGDPPMVDYARSLKVRIAALPRQPVIASPMDVSSRPHSSAGAGASSSAGVASPKALGGVGAGVGAGNAQGHIRQRMD